MTEKIKPEQRFTMERDGFYGEYYRAKDNAFPDKCMIAFGGSVGKFLLSQMMAWEFAAAGMDVLILAYHGEPGLPKLLKDQPVDVIEKAAMWLKARGYEKIGLWGVSMGGCLALLAGSLLPELISCVVASAPMEMVPQAEDNKCPLPGSAFSFHGRSLPYVRYIPDGKAWKKAFLKETLRHKEPCTIDLLRTAYEKNDEPEAVIKIWNIRGPILVLGSEMDSMCPDVETIRRYGAQLKEHAFPYRFESRIYPHLGHFILPVRPYSSALFLSERKYKKECAAERKQSWEDTLAFLRAW